MAVGWLVVLQSIPWTEVIRNAPKVAAAAKKLWDTAMKKSFSQNVPEPSSETHAASELTDVSAMQKRIITLEANITDLNSRMLASSEVIKELADQNTQFVRRIETHRLRIIWLTILTAATTVVALLSLVLVLSRP